MSTLSRQVARRRALAAKMAASMASEAPRTASDAPRSLRTAEAHPRAGMTTEGVTEAPVLSQETSGSTGLTNPSQNPSEARTGTETTKSSSAPLPASTDAPAGSQSLTYPTDWETEMHSGLLHISFYQDRNLLVTLPVSNFMEISETLAVQALSPDEQATRWVLTDPEDPELPPILNLLDGAKLKHQVALDSDLSNALYPLVRREATIKDEPRSWRAWAKKNKWKAYSLYGFGGTIGAIFLYNSILTWLSPALPQ